MHLYDVAFQSGRGVRGARWLKEWSLARPWVDDGKRPQAPDARITKLCKRCAPLRRNRLYDFYPGELVPGGRWLTFWSFVFIVDNGKRLKELGMSVTKLWSIVHVYVVIHDMVPIRGNGLGGGWLRGWSLVEPWVDGGKRLQALDV